MTRKDSEKDSERPHYYSQFWLDVAAGRRVIGGPKPDEGTEVAEPETPEPMILRKSGRNSSSDGYGDTYSRAAVEPPPEEIIEPEAEAEVEPELEPEEFEMVDEVDDLDLPNILVDDTLDEAAEDTDLAEMDTDLLPEEEEDEDFFDEEEEEEDEDWPIGRGRKKPKPGRQVKPPKPVKKPRRDTRRGGY